MSDQGVEMEGHWVHLLPPGGGGAPIGGSFMK